MKIIECAPLLLILWYRLLIGEPDICIMVISAQCSVSIQG